MRGEEHTSSGPALSRHSIYLCVPPPSRSYHCSGSIIDFFYIMLMPAGRSCILLYNRGGEGEAEGEREGEGEGERRRRREREREREKMTEGAREREREGGREREEAGERELNIMIIIIIISPGPV